MTELLALLVFAALVWFWLDGMTAREIAVNAARNACQSDGLQFLDDTVAFARLRLRRNAHGQLVPLRTYRFEFSDSGDNRLRGTVEMLGRRVETLDLENRWLEVRRPQ